MYVCMYVRYAMRRRNTRSKFTVPRVTTRSRSRSYLRHYRIERMNQKREKKWRQVLCVKLPISRRGHDITHEFISTTCRDTRRVSQKTGSEKNLGQQNFPRAFQNRTISSRRNSRSWQKKHLIDRLKIDGNIVSDRCGRNKYIPFLRRDLGSEFPQSYNPATLPRTDFLGHPRVYAKHATERRILRKGSTRRGFFFFFYLSPLHRDITLKVARQTFIICIFRHLIMHLHLPSVKNRRG